MRTSTIVAIAILAAASTAAAAAPRAYEFRVDLTSGSLAGETVRGTFSIDDALFVRGAPGERIGNPGLSIPALSVTFGGFSFTPANADATFLASQSTRLIDFTIGGAPNGFDTVAAGTADFLLGPGYFAYALPGDAFVGSGDVAYLAPVPAPAAIALMGVGALTIARRRRGSGRA